MLKVEALVRPERINAVCSALDGAGSTGYYYENVTGQGRQQGVEVLSARGTGVSSRSAVPKTKITTIIADNLLDKVLEAILDAARSPSGGQIGDGKIFVSEIKDVVRVSSGERGDIAA